MKRNSFLLSAVAAVCVLCLALSGCSKGNKFTEGSDGKYVDNKTKITYLSAPACYEPINMGDSVYGELGITELYAIEGADPQKWLCETSGSVLYAEGVKLPSLAEMNISYANIVDNDNAVVTVRDGSVIGEIVRVYTEGERIRRPMVLESAYSANVRIKFADETIGIYYILAYVELKEDYTVLNDDGTETNYGKKFIFNRFDGTCVAAGDVLSGIIRTSEATE